jgi:preprotein translocase subunit Sec61beta
MASNKVSMPMSSAGIVGLSPDVQTGGKEIDPKMIIAIVVATVIIVHVAAFVMTKLPQ